MADGVYLTREELAALLSATVLATCRVVENIDGDAVKRSGAFLTAALKSRTAPLPAVIASFAEHNPWPDEWRKVADQVIASKPPSKIPIKRRCDRCGDPYPAALLAVVDAEVRKALTS